MALTTYSTGTVSVDVNGAVTVAGGIWSGPNVVAGDMVSVDGGAAVLLSDVSDVTHGQLVGWTGGAVSGKAYVAYQCSSLRFDDVQIAQDLQKQVAALNTEGFYIFVPSVATDPDTSLGDNGQYAFQATTGKLWVKDAGLWGYLGIYKGFGFKGTWSSAAAYTVNDVVTLAGSSYIATAANTNQAPPNASYWAVLVAKGDDGGAIVIPYIYGAVASGKANLNNPSSQKDSTTIDISTTDSRGIDFGSVMATMGGGTSAVKQILRIYKSGDQSKFLIFQVTSFSAGAGYYAIGTTWIGGSSNSPFLAGDAFVFAFSSVGDKGNTGNTGSTGATPLLPIAAWATATAYVVGPPASYVSQGGSSYQCLIAHTSGASFNTDLAAGKWGLVAQKGQDGTGVGDMLASVYDPAGVANNAFNGLPVANRTALASLDVSKFSSAYLFESGRAGQFKWDSSNLSSYVALDTQQGIYIAPAAAPTGASGAWVRVIENATWQTNWFAMPTTGDAAPVWSTIVNLANAIKPTWIVVDDGIYTFNSAPPKFTYIFGIKGANSGVQPPIFLKNYAESDDTRGMVHSDNFGFTTDGINLRCAGGSGGALLSVKTTGTASTVGEIRLRNMNISPGLLATYSVYINGETATVDPKGVRDVYIDNCYIFGATNTGLYVKSCQSLHIGVGTVTSVGGGAGSYAAIFTGTSAVMSDNVMCYSTIAGPVSYDYVSNIHVERISGNLLNTGNAINATVGICTGTIGTSWGAGCGHLATGLHSFGTGWEKRIDGRIKQWGSSATSGGSASVTFPKTFASAVSFAFASVTDAPGASYISVLQTYNLSTTGMSVKNVDLTNAPGYSGTSSVNFRWTAEGL